MRVFTNNRVPIGRTHVQMNAATLDKSMAYVSSAMNTGPKDVAVPFMPMTSNRMENTLRMVSNQVTKRAMQMKETELPV